MLEFNRIYNEDCFAGLARIPDKSVDLVLTDPPYNVRKAEWDKWRTVDKYVEWCGRWLHEAERVLKDNGSMYFFHNDFEQLADLQYWIKRNTAFVLNSFIIWHKPMFRALGWKDPTDKNTLRSWFNVCEYIAYFTFQDGTGRDHIMLDVNNFATLRGYFDEVRKLSGLNKSQLLGLFGHRVDHCFRSSSTQWDMPTPETYADIVAGLNLEAWEGYRAYDDLRAEYEALRAEYEGERLGFESRRFTHNLDPNHCNVWTSNEQNNGKLHPCEKPLDILRRIVLTSSNEGGLVLDPFMGSGSTAVACIQTRRQFVGFELDGKHFATADKRIKEHNRGEENEKTFCRSA